MSLSNLRENLGSALDTLKDGFQQVENFVSSNPIASAIGGSTAVVGAGLAISAAVKRRKKPKKIKYKRSRKKSRSYRSRKSRRRTPRTAGKRKDRSSKRIRYTKKGQPYVIKANGRAMFIKKSSAKQSHKRKGGRY